MIAHDSDCGVCGDSGLVLGEYDGDGYERVFCTRCVRGEELADQAFRDTLQHPEMQ